MQVTKWICDRCGNWIQEAEIYRIMVGNATNIPDEFSDECERDYCKACMDAIVGFAHLPYKEVDEGKMKPKATKKPASVPKQTGPNRVELDDGMIVTLRQAGWTFEKIADEILLRTHHKVSAQTVINHYNSAVKKMQEKSSQEENDE